MLLGSCVVGEIELEISIMHPLFEGSINRKIYFKRNFCNKNLSLLTFKHQKCFIWMLSCPIYTANFNIIELNEKSHLEVFVANNSFKCYDF